MSATVEIPEGLSAYLRRELPSGGLIEFEERRETAYRAYYWTPQPECLECQGTGRQPSQKRPTGTVKCEPCKGTGACKRERMVSVTTLLDAILPKPGLPPWAEARGIEGVIAALELGEIDSRTEPADAIKIVRGLKLGADAARDTAADRGLDIHSLLEVYMRTGDAPPQPANPKHWGYYQGLCSWLLARDLEPESVEQIVCDPVARYAGRRDLVARCSGVRIGYDAKTQERAGIYSSAHVQLKLYERADIVCGSEPCDELRAVVFAADGNYREMPCAATDRTVERALAFYEDIKPIDSECEGWNRHERKARRS